MNMLRIILLFAGVALVAGAAGVFGQPYLQKIGVIGPSDTRPPQVNGKQDPARAVTSLGRLEPESQVIQVSALAGSRIERLGEKVKEGAYVAKDEPLAYLDSYAELLAARDLAQSQLNEAKERLKAETAFGQAAIAAAKLKIRHAEEVMPKQIEAQDAEVRRSMAELDKCRIDQQRSEKMLADRAVPQSQHDSVVLQYRQCQEQWERNKATLDHLRSDREIKVLMGRADLKSAEAGLVRAELSTQVESLASALKMAQARLERAVIKAPIDGEIIQVLTRAGESVGRDPIVKMGNTKSMYAIAEVYETDVRFVRPGQKATITSRAFPPDEKLTGVVERVGSLVFKNDVLGLDPTKDADTRVIEVRIRLDGNRVAAKYNFLQVDVSISRDES
ncbi:MAG: efflux RND transporter periplasmic adaptor subunit [Gemmataceae bacterium]|nr:efflux RND transporter periplasmic adaptor subunit [Gemmataceae bacterium]